MNKITKLSELRMRMQGKTIRNFRLYPDKFHKHVTVKYQEAIFIKQGGYTLRTWLDMIYPNLLAD